MFSRKTTLILGAGASAELGLPLGRSLQAKIQQQLKSELEILQQANVNQLHATDAPIAVALSRRGRNHNSIKTTHHKLAEGVVEGPSIDTFLHNNSHDPLMVEAGKAAIVHQILTSEQQSFASNEYASRRHFESENQHRQVPHNIGGLKWDTYAIQNSYLGVVWDEVCQDHGMRTVDKMFDNLSVINFNYDRSIEYVLHRKLSRTFPDIRKEVCNRIVDAIDVIRPYGSPHGSEAYSEASLAYGSEDLRNLSSYIDNIRTYTEAIDENLESRIKSTIMASEVVIILGFGFHRQNLDLISSGGDSRKSVYFSALGLSVDDMEAYRREILRRIVGAPPHDSVLINQVRATQRSCAETLSTFRHGIFRA